MERPPEISSGAVFMWFGNTFENLRKANEFCGNTSVPITPRASRITANWRPALAASVRAHSEIDSTAAPSRSYRSSILRRSQRSEQPVHPDLWINHAL